LKKFKKGIDFLWLQYYIYCSDKKKRGDKMSPRTGRPKSDNSKDVMFRVRLDKDMVEKLEKASENLNITKSDVVRNGIESEYQRSIKK
jgi:predicted DNA-binding protein